MASVIYLYLLIGFTVSLWHFADGVHLGITDEDCRDIVDRLPPRRHENWVRRLARSMPGMSALFGIFWPMALWIWIVEDRRP